MIDVGEYEYGVDVDLVCIYDVGVEMVVDEECFLCVEVG